MDARSEKCHATYTTDFEPQQEEECNESFIMSLALRIPIYRVSQNWMSFSRQLKMPEKRNLHNKTRLFYYQYIPPFRFVANYFIKICHKCSKFQNSWKIVTKIYQIFFLQNQFFNENLLFWSHINIFWEAKNFWKFFMLYYFFQKIAISIFLKTSTTPRGMNGIDGLWGP